MGSRDHVLDGGSDPPWEEANFWGKMGVPLYSIGTFSVVYGKTAEPIEMPVALWVPMVPKNHKLDGVPIAHENGQFLGKRLPIVKYRDFLPCVVQIG